MTLQRWPRTQSPCELRTTKSHPRKLSLVLTLLLLVLSPVYSHASVACAEQSAACAQPPQVQHGYEPQLAAAVLEDTYMRQSVHGRKLGRRFSRSKTRTHTKTSTSTQTSSSTSTRTHTTSGSSTATRTSTSSNTHTATATRSGASPVLCYVAAYCTYVQLWDGAQRSVRSCLRSQHVRLNSDTHASHLLCCIYRLLHCVVDFDALYRRVRLQDCHRHSFVVSNSYAHCDCHRYTHDDPHHHFIAVANA